ncbi:MAG: hypothetical protein PHX08_00955 [Lachnospiraceae bacterium]|nr:hypothetical protein [Lachnospiraceae bacterium]
MKEQVEVYGLNEVVEFDTDNVKSFTTSSGDEYEESVVTTDGMLIAYDEAICEWVQLGVSGDL